MMPRSVGTTTTRFFAFGTASQPFDLNSGESAPEVTLAYETYSEPAANRDSVSMAIDNIWTRLSETGLAAV